MTSSSVPARTPAAGIVLIPPVAFALAAVGQRVLARRKKRTRKCRQADEPEACKPRRAGGRQVLSAGVGVTSLALLAAGGKELSEAGTTFDARDPAQASALVTSGVFARTRNPLYLGLTALLLAHALWLGSKRAIVPAGGFVLLMDRCQIPAEEAALAEKFGKAYRTYTELVPRWVL